MSDFLKHVLRNKLSTSTEIELHLFEFCNLSCAFCGQNHDATEGMDESSLLDKADKVTNFMQSSGLTSHIINLMGGEIFNDLVPDEVFNHYVEFHKVVSSWAKLNQHTVRFNWVTNLIFANWQRVDEFLNAVNQIDQTSYISTSYDFSGRGFDLNRSLVFESNLTRFANYITVVGFVLTKPSIRKIMLDKDRFFKEVLYKNYTLYFDYYVPELSVEKMLPSDQEMLDCLIFIAENYPEIYPVKDLLENSENNLTCYSMNKLTLLPSGREVKCRYMDYKDSDFLTTIDYSSNENIIESHMERHGCLGCKWFDRCAMRCFVQSDWATLERTNDCMFREFFNTMDSKGLLSWT